MIIKKFLSIFLAFVMSFGISSVAFASDEIPEGYTPIYTAEDLNNIRNNLSGSYILMNDIDLSVYENWEPIGTKEAPFAGTLDGNSKIISNLKITSVTDEGYAGLFGYIQNAEVKKLTVDGNIDLYPEIVSYVGMLCGENDGSTVSSCVSSGTISVTANDLTYVGGITGISSSKYNVIAIGQNINTADIEVQIKNCTQNRAGSIGGLVGQVKGALSECVNKGDIKVNNSASKTNKKLVSVGGITGYNNYALFDCYNTGDISLSGIGYLCVGGISGYWSEDADFSNTYNIGNVSANAQTEDCYDVETGAIVGHAEPSIYFDVVTFPVIKNCFYLNAAESAMGDSSDVSEAIDVKALTIEEMKNQASFAGFDFDTVWVMEEGGYPVLRNQPKIKMKEESISLNKGDLYSANIITDWASSDATVAFVNENGEIEAIGEGTAVITVNLSYGFFMEYIVTVADPELPAEPVEPEPPTEPNEPTDPKPICPIINNIIKLIKNIWAFAINIVNWLIDIFK